MSDQEQQPAIKKPRKQRPMRKRKGSDEDSGSDSNDESHLGDLKEVQKMRKRPNGISLAGLATGRVTSIMEEAVSETDPFKLSTGGFIDMKKITKKEKRPSTEAIGTAFAAETNQRDEDAEMQKYVEQEMARRKGLLVDESPTKDKKLDPEALLYSLPDHLKAESGMKKNEDLLSNQMLSGIPEVDLGISAKIRNIEATEEAKQKLMAERLKKKDEVSKFVPTNMAVNFAQHNRYKLPESSMLPQEKSKDEKILKQFKDRTSK